ncbi:MAG: GcrA family cell cycle regulator [Hyphomicrobiaceae bacterium]
MSWSDERVEMLKKLWSEGLSASQIASRLGEVTRNAVIGKVHRLGLSGRATTSRIKTMRPRKSVARAKRHRPVRFPQTPGVPRRDPFAEMVAEGALEPVFRQVEELVIPLEERKTIQTLKECNCRWPIGDPQAEDFHFCGRDKEPGRPYCSFHAARAYQPVQPRRRDNHRSVIRQLLREAGETADSKIANAG